MKGVFQRGENVMNLSNGSYGEVIAVQGTDFVPYLVQYKNHSTWHNGNELESVKKRVERRY